MAFSLGVCGDTCSCHTVSEELDLQRGLVAVIYGFLAAGSLFIWRKTR